MGMLISGTLRALIQQHIITIDQAQALSEQAMGANCDIEDYLYYHTRYDSNVIAKACAQYFAIPHLDQHNMIPTRFDECCCYFDDGVASYKFAALSDATQAPHFISAQLFYKLKQQHVSPDSSVQQHTTIAKLDTLLSSALIAGASDIHLEPFCEHYQVRLRIDGTLTHHAKFSHELTQQLITRLKVLAKIDITQSRLPQDGHFTLTQSQANCDCRLSFCPTIWGEKIVIRLLNSNRHIAQVNELGLTDQQQKTLLNTLNCKQGLILVTGPTGSGKTQTLYTLLNHLKQSQLNIVSIEDPVEIKLNGINQIQVNDAIKLSFAVILRALLRQDPDVIMIGEIRDCETAQLAIRAAHTGHLVLATLHTKNAVEAINRLQNFGISRYEIASTLRLTIAQRLVRRLQANKLGQRMAIFELLSVSETIRQAIHENHSIDHLRQLITHEGFESMQQQGLKHIAHKQTTLAELMRVIDIDENAHA